jgi:hypothetical protein
MSTTLKSMAAAVAIALAATSFAGPAEARGDRAVAAGAVGVSAIGGHGHAVAGRHARHHVVHHRPHSVVVYRPWTAAWYSHCRKRYVTFNPRTGYFIAHGGKRRFCR